MRTVPNTTGLIFLISWIFAIAMNIISPAVAMAEDVTVPSLTLQYILKWSNNDYRMYLDNRDDTKQYRIRLGTTNIDPGNQGINKDNIQINNFLRASGDLGIEQSDPQTSSGMTTYTVSATTSTIGIRSENETYFKWNLSLLSTIGSGSAMLTYSIPLNRSVTDDVKTNSGIISKQFQVSVNGSDVTVVPFAGSYEAGKYYFINENTAIGFLAKNLADRTNEIILKIDSIPSNSVSITKERYELGDVTTEFNDGADPALLSFSFTKPGGIRNVGDFSMYVNGKKLDPNNVFITSGKLIARVPLDIFSSNSKIAAIYLQDELDGMYSDTKIVNVDEYLKCSITGVEFWSLKGTNFSMRIHGSRTAFNWDIYKLKVNINGTDYAQDGADGHRIIMTRTGDGIAFDAFGSYFSWWLNKLFVSNGNSSRTSNTVTIRSSSGEMEVTDYGLSQTGSAVESMVFTGWTVMSKTANFIITPGTSIALGQMAFSNLWENEGYDIGFQIKTNLKMNPFSSVRIGSIPLPYQTDGDGYVVFNYAKTGVGKDLGSGGEITLALNGLFNTDGSIRLNLQNAYIRKYSVGGDKISSVFSKSNLGGMSLAYRYVFGECFDGSWSFCEKLGLAEPSLSIAVAKGDSVAAIANPTSSFLWSTSPSVTPTSSAIRTPNIRTPNIRSGSIRNVNSKSKLRKPVKKIKVSRPVKKVQVKPAKNSR